MKNWKHVRIYACLVLVAALIDNLVPRFFASIFHPIFFNYDPLTILIFRLLEIDSIELLQAISFIESIVFSIVVLFFLIRRIKGPYPRFVFKIEIPIMTLVYLVFRMTCPVLFILLIIELSLLDAGIIIFLPTLIVWLWMIALAHVLIRMRGRL